MRFLTLAEALVIAEAVTGINARTQPPTPDWEQTTDVERATGWIEGHVEPRSS